MCCCNDNEDRESTEPEIKFVNLDGDDVPWGDSYDNCEYQILGVTLRRHSWARDDIVFTVRGYA